MILDKICRVCLGEGELISLYKSEHTSPCTMIMICTTIKIAENDGLPSALCATCLDRLSVSFQFKKQCEASDFQLKQYLAATNKSKASMEQKSNIPSGETFFDENLCETLEVSNHNLDVSNIPNVQMNSVVKPKVPAKAEKYSAKIQLSPRKTKENKKVKQKKINLSNMPFIDPQRNAMIKRLSKSKHKNLDKPDKCFDCGKLFYYTGYLEAHLRTHTGEKPYSCNVCKKKFTQKGNLSLHMRIHTGEKRFQCEICSKRFSTSSNFHAHQKIHSETRNFPCTQCPRAFKSSTELTSHTGTHTGIKNHICKICGKAFYKISYLNIHIKAVHMGEKKYKCTECEKEFSSSSNLRCHFRIHTGEKPFSCNICEARFNQSSALQRHRRQHQTLTKKNKSMSAEGNGDTDPNLVSKDYGKHNSLYFDQSTDKQCEPAAVEYAKTQPALHYHFMKTHGNFMYHP